MEEKLNPGVEERQAAAVEDAAELMQEKGEGSGAADQSAEVVQEEPREDIAFSRRLAAARQKMEQEYTQSREYQLGRMVLSGYADIDPEEATQKAIDDLVATQAKALQENPEALAREVIKQRFFPQQQYQPDPVAARAQDLVDESFQLQSTGKLPKGYDVVGRMKADPQFRDDCINHGLETALLISERTKPKTYAPIRPQGAVSASTPDFANMSKEDFAKFDAQVARAELRGEKFKI